MERGERTEASALEDPNWHFREADGRRKGTAPRYVSVSRLGWYNVPVDGGGM